jgi:hypothetical protein
MVDRGVFSDIFNPLTFVDEAVRSFAATQGPVDLGPDFAPGVGSVICGRGTFPPCFGVRFRWEPRVKENERPSEHPLIIDTHAFLLSPTHGDTCSISAYCWAACTTPAHFSYN